MLMRSALTVLALFAALTHAQDEPLECFKGFVMDIFCIDRGTLLDRPSVETLRNPELHSYHCLVDVQRCVTSGYEMLADPQQTGNELYGRFLRLDDTGNALVVDLARRTGASGGCSSCSGVDGSESQGFSATVVGTRVPNSGTPAVFATQMALPIGDACPDGSTEIFATAEDTSTEQGGDATVALTHGSLMLVSWGFILPLGVISARFLRHRPNAIWFKMHRILQPLGLIIAIIGWSFALRNFNVLGSGDRDKAYAHAVCGTTAMCVGFLQPLNAVVRPHPPEADQKKSTWRLVWEVCHKGFGYIAIILALVTIGLGTKIIGSYESQFQAGFIASLVVLAFLAFIMIVDKICYKPKEEPPKEQPVGSEELALNEEAEQTTGNEGAEQTTGKEQTSGKEEAEATY